MSFYYIGSSGNHNQYNFYISGKEALIHDLEIYHPINGTFDGGGSAITDGSSVFVNVPYNGTISGAVLLADITGSVILDVWKGTYANYPLNTGHTAVTGANAVKLSINNDIKSQQSNFTGWNSQVSAGDIVGYKVNGITGITWLSAQLKVY